MYLMTTSGQQREPHLREPSFKAAQQAAKLRLTIDRRLDRDSDPRVVELAEGREPVRIERRAS